ncbi:MAG: 2Fe-2S iron-sulfur cluster-binding protein [Acidobacteriaceae bacterium]
MSEAARSIPVTVNGAIIRVVPGTTVAAAVLQAAQTARVSGSGEPRGPLCGMGICFECRVTIDGVPHQRSCMMLCTPGIRVTTEEMPADSVGSPSP